MGLQRPGRSYVDQGEGLCRELAQAWDRASDTGLLEQRCHERAASWPQFQPRSQPLPSHSYFMGLRVEQLLCLLGGLGT